MPRLTRERAIALSANEVRSAYKRLSVIAAEDELTGVSSDANDARRSLIDALDSLAAAAITKEAGDNG